MDYDNDALICTLIIIFDVSAGKCEVNFNFCILYVHKGIKASLRFS